MDTGGNWITAFDLVDFDSWTYTALGWALEVSKIVNLFSDELQKKPKLLIFRNKSGIEHYLRVRKLNIGDRFLKISEHVLLYQKETCTKLVH